MTVRLVVSCDGKRPAGSTEPCRAKLPTRARLIDPPDAAQAQAEAAGWTVTAHGDDLCPSCSRAAS